MKTTKEAIRNITKFIDLYQWSITVKLLKKQFTFVSWCKNSIPTPGSLTLLIEKLNENNDTIVEKVTIHKNNTLTLVTNQGYLKFTN